MDIKVIASGSSGNCYRISDGETTFLLDAGIPFKSIQIGCDFQTSGIRGCLVTHRHGDHAKAVPKLLERGIPVYGPEDLQEIYTKRVKRLKPLEHYNIGMMDVLAFPTQHDVECYGYLIRSLLTGDKLLYVTDSAYIKYRFSGLTHIMVEANYSQDIIMDNARGNRIPAFLAERIIKKQMSIETTLQMLKANDLHQVRQIYLLHLSDGNSDAAKFKAMVQKETGAEVYVY